MIRYVLFNFQFNLLVAIVLMSLWFGIHVSKYIYLYFVYSYDYLVCFITESVIYSPFTLQYVTCHAKRVLSNPIINF